jgi:hypothetical protein
LTADADNEGAPTWATSATLVTVKKILNDPDPAFPLASAIVKPTKY